LLMIIGGLQKITLIDYPGKIAATVFLAGCNFRCPWCYSSELVLPEKIKLQPEIKKKDFFEFLKSKKGFLEGVVICGGEPCLNKDLEGFIKKIKELEYSVKIDTNGSHPDFLRRLVGKKLVDYVAMDIKAPKEKYREAVGGRVNLKNIKESVDFLKENRVDYEFRTTVIPKIIEKKDVLKIVEWISGAKKYYLQTFKPEKNLNQKFGKLKPYSKEYLLEIQKTISPFFEICKIR